MSTEDHATQGKHDPAIDMDAYLRDPLSIPEDADLESLAAGTKPATSEQPSEATGNGDGEGAETAAKQQGENNGDAPGTGTAEGEQGKDGAAAADPDKAEQAGAGGGTEAKPAGVASKDGKYIIPYEELRLTRERATRAEMIAQELTAKLEALEREAETGKASRTRDVSDIVDDETMTALREESPQVAGIIDKLIERIGTATEQVHSAQAANAEAEREQRVQALVSVEDAIAAHPKLVHTRAHDPVAFGAIAQIDTVLAKQERWKDKPLDERFGAAVRMYEAANGAIELPGTTQAQPNQPAAKQQPADTDARVAAAVAQAKAAAAGPSTLSDIPGGHPAPGSDQDALGEMTSAALTERFMTMTPEQIEAELARLS